LTHRIARGALRTALGARENAHGIGPGKAHGIALGVALGIAVLLPSSVANAQSAADWSVLERARTLAPKPTTPAITAEDLRSRIFQYADDSMRGRLLGDVGNVKATAYIASELKRLGLEPAGDNGSYLQLVPAVERVFDENSRLRLGDQPLEAWKDYVLRDQGPGQRSIDDVPTVYAGVWGESSKLIARAAAAGKVVIVATRTDEVGSGVPGLPNRQQVFAYFQQAAAIMVVGLETMPPEAIAAYRAASEPGMPEANPAPRAAYFYITNAVARAVFGGDPRSLAAGTPGRSFAGNPSFTDRLLAQPPYNVVGILRGSDATLRNEYVAIGAHNDHIGIEQQVPAAHDSTYVVNHLFREQGADNPPPRLTPADAARVNTLLAEIRRKTGGASARIDSVYNGADDDGTGSMSVLEMAEYFASLRPNQRPKRSLLFIWHVGEEAGLWGSEWFTDHPTVPRESIVTELNMDMVGRGAASDVTGQTKDGKLIRGNDSYVQLIGSRRLSTELGDLVEKVNRDRKHNMSLDYALDADGHPQNIYCRSDHERYARYGIPIVFFTTGGHADYHQLTDEPQYIEYDHMTRVVNFVRDIATDVANLTNRPRVDKPKPDPKGTCQQ